MVNKDYKKELEKAALRKSKREEKRLTLPWGKDTHALAKGEFHVTTYKIAHKRKPKATPSRRQAFNRLGANCRKYILLRAKFRKGHCEVGVACHGYGTVEVWYHVTPQSSGNALRYDDRNILGSCHACNAGEYNARKSHSDRYEVRHEFILGKSLLQELKLLQGRRQISTVEANEMADEYKKRCEEFK